MHSLSKELLVATAESASGYFSEKGYFFIVCCFIDIYYTPGSGEHGPRFLTGGPGAAPGGVASKNGWVYMRVQRGVISYSLVCPYVTKQPFTFQKMACTKGCAFAEARRGINSAA